MSKKTASSSSGQVVNKNNLKQTNTRGIYVYLGKPVASSTDAIQIGIKEAFGSLVQENEKIQSTPNNNKE